MSEFKGWPKWTVLYNTVIAGNHFVGKSYDFFYLERDA